MLKRRLLGRKNRKPSARFRNRRKQDAASSVYYQHPFADRFVVCRVNPIYVDDCHHNSGLPAFLSSNEDFQLHVQTWCSIVCPRHLSTCCVCKPVSIYCDRCGTKAKPYDEFAFDYSKQNSNCHHDLQRNKLEKHWTKPHKKPLPPLPPPKRMTDTALAEESGREAHHYHDIGPVVGGHDPVDHAPHYEQPVPLTSQLMRNVRKKPKPLHVYMNSEFVSGITVPIKNKQVHLNGKEQQLLESSPGTSKQILPEYNLHSETLEETKDFELRQKGLNEVPGLSVINLEQGLFVREEPPEDIEEMDSLESLKIDEGMFQMGNAEGVFRNETSSSINIAKLSLAGLFSSAAADVQLPDDEVAYEAVKDLYEKLSNNKHRKVLTQAMNSNSTQRSHSGSLRGYAHTTYETLTKHARRSYAKLVDEEARRTSSPPTTYYDNILLRSADHVSSKTYANINSGHFSLVGSRRQSDQSGNGRVVARDNFSEVIYETPISSEQVMNQIETDLASQFHLPKPLDTNPNNLRSKNETGSSEGPFFKKLEKRFESRAFRDACKIIVTTLLGLTAFGIITALSLSVK